MTLDLSRIQRRSPIFWGLIALVLFISVPGTILMVPPVVNLFVTYFTEWVSGGSFELSGSATWASVLSIIAAGMLLTTALVTSVAAMLCLIFKKYRAAKRLIIIAPVCFILQVSIAATTQTLGESWMPVTPDVLIKMSQYLMVTAVLFYYARKYNRMDSQAGSTA